VTLFELRPSSPLPPLQVHILLRFVFLPTVFLLGDSEDAPVAFFYSLPFLVRFEIEPTAFVQFCPISSPWVCPSAETVTHPLLRRYGFLMSGVSSIRSMSLPTLKRWGQNFRVSPLRPDGPLDVLRAYALLNTHVLSLPLGLQRHPILRLLCFGVMCLVLGL